MEGPAAPLTTIAAPGPASTVAGDIDLPPVTSTEASTEATSKLRLSSQRDSGDESGGREPKRPRLDQEDQDGGDHKVYVPEPHCQEDALMKEVLSPEENDAAGEVSKSRPTDVQEQRSSEESNSVPPPTAVSKAAVSFPEVGSASELFASAATSSVVSETLPEASEPGTQEPTAPAACETPTLTIPLAAPSSSGQETSKVPAAPAPVGLSPKGASEAPAPSASPATAMAAPPAKRASEAPTAVEKPPAVAPAPPPTTKSSQTSAAAAIPTAAPAASPSVERDSAPAAVTAATAATAPKPQSATLTRMPSEPSHSMPPKPGRAVQRTPSAPALASSSSAAAGRPSKPGKSSTAQKPAAAKKTLAATSSSTVPVTAKVPSSMASAAAPSSAATAAAAPAATAAAAPVTGAASAPATAVATAAPSIFFEVTTNGVRVGSHRTRNQRGPVRFSSEGVTINVPAVPEVPGNCKIAIKSQYIIFHFPFTSRVASRGGDSAGL